MRPNPSRRNVFQIALFMLGVCFCTPSHATPVISLNLVQLEDLPVQNEGRNKPFFTFARESLVQIHGFDTFTDPSSGERFSAVEVAAALWFNPEGWENRPLIQVALKPLREKMKLAPNRRFFSYDELVSNSEVIAAVDEVRALQRREERPKLSRAQREASNLANRLFLFASLHNGTLFTSMPLPLANGKIASSWLAPASPQAAELPAFNHWVAMREAFIKKDQQNFNKALNDFRETIKSTLGGSYPSQSVIALEHLYAQTHPFRWAWIAYALAAVALLVFAKGQTARVGYAVGWIFTLSGFALQVFGFYCRSAISGRPPVSNMYESLIWVGFGVVLFGIIFEVIHRCRIFLLAAVPAAMISLYVADSVPQILDPSIHPLQAVLQDNFWLTTHVLTITLSYAAFLLALALGHIIVGKTLFGNRPEDVRPIYTYLYRALQIGVLLLATGVVLGAFWANYSWGRFWDWDPKETWSLIALLSYLIILHGRIAGWWSGFGMAVGAIFAFLAVLMAWYGVNFVLGVGLHSYGFGTGGFGYVLTFVAAEILFVLAAMLRAGQLKKAINPAKLPPCEALKINQAEVLQKVSQ